MAVHGEESHEEEVVMNLLGGERRDDPPEQGGRVTNFKFGAELTNSPSKRGAYGNGEVARTSPCKPTRR